MGSEDGSKEGRNVGFALGLDVGLTEFEGLVVGFTDFGINVGIRVGVTVTGRLDGLEVVETHVMRSKTKINPSLKFEFILQIS